MKLLVNPHKIEIEKTPINEREIDITKCEFEFANEITSDYVKEAYFTFNGTSYKQIIVNNECDIPNEVLEKKGQVEIGVVAYLVDNNEEIKRYNPSPAYFNTWLGSLKDNYENSEPITPTDKEQIESQINSLQNNKQDTLISGENIKTINNESLLGAGNLEVITDLSDYYNKNEANALLDTKENKITATNLLSSDLVDDFNNTHKFVTLEEKTTWNNKMDSFNLNDYYNKSQTDNLLNNKANISDLPTKTSDLTNDSNYTTKTYVDTLVGDISSVIDTINGEVI